MKNKAFTLSEVLITLGIIGVVAAMTLPALIQNHKKHVIENKLKKIYTVMNQAIQHSIAENGDVNEWVIDCGPSNSPTCTVEETQKWFQDYIGKHLNILKYEQKDSYILVHLNDGSILRVNQYLYDMAFYPDAKALDRYNNNDGTKKYTRDCFSFRFNPVILNHQNDTENTSAFFEPYAHDWNGTRDGLFSGYYGCSESGTGGYCTKLIQYDGWKISKDYPWK